jgi:tetratricopeptide (TPR) repeat protein
MENIFSKVFQRPCSLMMALLLVLVPTVAGAQSLLRVSDDSYKRGLDRFKKGDLTGAIQEFDQALDAYLSNRAAYGAGNNNNASRVNEDLEGVAVDYGDWVVHVPRAAAIYQNRGLARLRLGETDAAIGDFNESIKLAPRNAGVYLYRGIAIQTKGDLESALADYNQAIGLYTRDAEAW